ncbi:HisA/HisF-related TIM barrel protein [Mongoliimonas terrestris]|uniref:HisA/HisF-related TIM barrel protein n=1 Tax=Mongoliimonas terrestris TaxID=1709001 RepID=UPI0009497A37|nr:HisA/HisF-related TIM barrel protein [Mongoliimonas terrestris]
MRVIPVIDLKGGLVVRARAGERDAYRPIESPLTASAEPDDVVAGLMSVFPFDTLYIADLDAIEGRGHHRDTVARLAARHQGLSVWLDEGAANRATADGAAAIGARPVIGSESQADSGLVRGAGRGAVLSLDFRTGFVGPAEILDTPGIWPGDVIVMTLQRVGVDAGPDFERLAAVRTAAGPERRVYAAGGVRGAADLDRLKAEGIAGALVATALHDGRIDRAVMDRLAGG